MLISKCRWDLTGIVGGTPTAGSPQIAVVLHSWNYTGHNLHNPGVPFPNDFDEIILWAELYPQNSYVEVSIPSAYECNHIEEIGSLKR